jgi:alpha-amylase
MYKGILLFVFTCFFYLCSSCTKEIDPSVIVHPVVELKPDADPPAYDIPFAAVPATKDIAMYEVNMRAFSSAGNFKGVQARLDSIKALGINVIWLMPIHPIGILKNAGELGSPYSVRDYKAVNPEYGTLEDLQILVKEAHARKIAVIIDWVANHTAWDNPWVTAHPTWYTQNASGQITIPAGTNWADVADLNFDNSEMRKFMINAMKYWILKANIDGYRCDYADGVPIDFWKQAIDTLNKMPNRKIIMLAEGGESSLFSAGFQMNYSWDFYNHLKKVYKNKPANTTILDIQNTEFSSIPSGAFKLRFTTNHDESAWNDTPINLFGGKDGSIGAFVIAAFSGGVPLIYCGQEVGRSDKTPFFSKSPINWNANQDLYQQYKKIMNFRQNSIALKSNSIQLIADSDVIAFKRVVSGEELLIIVNIQGKSSVFNMPAPIASSPWRNAMDNTNVSLLTPLNLQPYQYVILKR